MRGGGDSAPGELRVLGVDPGTAMTGWGVIARRGREVVHLGHGTIATRPRTALPVKLAAIHRALSDRSAEWRPHVLVIEKSFVGRNVQSAFRLGEVRGVAMLVAAAAGLPVAEYSPAEVKLAVTGAGRAEKLEVARALARELGLAGTIPADAADALAVALCHLHTAPLRAILAGTRSERTVIRVGA
jgi:crossover junction endodeoxyribonuclease RuvC